eukprot:COSAG02_NODE_1498_length_12281_cov_14.846741_11_plen_213_part_00
MVATSTHLYAFAECREWRGDGCDPMGSGSDSAAGDVGTAGERPLGARTHIAMKSSSDGGEHWSIIQILTEGCQPTAVYDAQHDTLLFMFKNNTRQDARLMTLRADGNWSRPRLVIDPAKQEKHHRPLFPGPGNAIMLSANHPTNPGRLLFPVWLGPDGTTTSASLYYSDDAGVSFRQTETTCESPATWLVCMRSQWRSNVNLPIFCRAQRWE